MDRSSKVSKIQKKFFKVATITLTVALTAVLIAFFAMKYKEYNESDPVEKSRLQMINSKLQVVLVVLLMFVIVSALASGLYPIIYSPIPF